MDDAENGRLDSWKEIAAHFRRSVRTMQNWERGEGLPVHRHRHKKLGSVYAQATSRIFACRDCRSCCLLRGRL